MKQYADAFGGIGAALDHPPAAGGAVESWVRGALARPWEKMESALLPANIKNPGKLRILGGGYASRMASGLRSGVWSMGAFQIDERAAVKQTYSLTKNLIAKPVMNAAKTGAMGAYHAIKFMGQSRMGRVGMIAGALLTGAAVGGASSLYDDVENTNPFSGRTAGVLQQIGGPLGLAGMAVMSARDRTVDMQGRDFVGGGMNQPAMPIQGPMSFSSGGSGRLSGVNLGASGSLTLALSNLRRG